MKKLSAIFVLLTLVFTAVAQTNTASTSPAKSEPEIFTYVEQKPEFPGGDAALMQFLSRNLKYPTIAKENHIEGKVIVKFVVNEDGSVGNASIVKGVNTALDAEAIRVIKILPKFTPGRQQGKAVKVYFNLPVNFILS